jgi:L-2,4-diaminobutyrate decarboxylase
VLKLWVALQRYGADGIGALFDDLCETTRSLHRAIDGDPRFEAIHEPECNILCFRYLGPTAELRQGSLQEMDALNAAVRDRYNRSGRGWITTTILDGRRVLRVTVMNPRTRPEHVRRMLEELAEEGSALAV